MSTKMTFEIESTSSAETENLAEKLGRQLKGGEVIELIGDVGGGKTTFTRGLARGMGSKDHVSSPTYKVCNVYNGKDLRLYHYDFYRLDEPGLIEHELAEAFNDEESVVVVEWADIVSHVLGEQKVTIYIKQTSDTSRRITFNFPAERSYLMP